MLASGDLENLEGPFPPEGLLLITAGQSSLRTSWSSSLGSGPKESFSPFKDYAPILPQALGIEVMRPFKCEMHVLIFVPKVSQVQQ